MTDLSHGTALTYADGDDTITFTTERTVRGEGRDFTVRVESIESHTPDTPGEKESLTVNGEYTDATGKDGDIEGFYLTTVRDPEGWGVPTAEAYYWNGAEYELSQSVALEALEVDA